MKYQPINLAKKFSQINDLWKPRVVVEMNNYQFKLAKVKGEFIWHDHPDTDEVFMVLEGSLDIHFRDGKVTLQKGEIYVVPKGVEHKPVADKECQIMVIEPRGVVNTGDIESDLKAQNDVWI